MRWNRPESRFGGLLGVLLVVGMLPVGCQSDPPSGAPLLVRPHNVGVFPREDPLRGSPTATELGRMHDEMRSYAAGHVRTNIPPDPPAWDRLPEAVDIAAESLELAVYGLLRDDFGMTFTLRSIDDVPVELVAVRTDDDDIFRLQATAGWFRDEDALADRLKRAVREAFEDLPPSWD